MLRTVVTTIDTVLEIFKDYLGPENVPQDAKATRILWNPQTRRVRIVAESAEWKAGLAPLQVRFDVKRVFLAGGTVDGSASD